MTQSASAPRRAAQAEHAYETLVARDPSRRLSPAVEAAIRDYAVEVLGSARFQPWLRVFAAVRGEFLPGWLPDTFLARHVLPALQGAAGRRLGANRVLARRLLATRLMPDLACRVRGFWLDREGRPLPEESLEKTLFARRAEVLLHRDGAGRLAAPEVLTRDCFARETLPPGDLTLQALPAQDPGLAALVPGALTLLRLVTLKPAGEPARLAGGLLRLARAGERLPRPGAEITLLLSSEGRGAGAALLPDWTRSPRHPDSGAFLAGVVLPGHEAAVAAVTALHDSLPQLTLAGWDLALGPKGRVQILDWEPEAPATAALQALLGPVFAGLGWEAMGRATPVEAATPRPALTLVPAAAIPPAAPEPVPEPAPVPAPVAAAEPALPEGPRRIVPRRPVLAEPARRRRA